MSKRNKSTNHVTPQKGRAFTVTPARYKLSADVSEQGLLAGGPGGRA